MENSTWTDLLYMDKISDTVSHPPNRPSELFEWTWRKEERREKTRNVQVVSPLRVQCPWNGRYYRVTGVDPLSGNLNPRNPYSQSNGVSGCHYWLSFWSNEKRVISKPVLCFTYFERLRPQSDGSKFRVEVVDERHIRTKSVFWRDKESQE